MGIRHLRDHNNAFMMKLGWGLITRRDALCVKVLLAKCRCGMELIPEVRGWKTCSKVWSSIVGNWDNTLKNAWNLGMVKLCPFGKIDGWTTPTNWEIRAPFLFQRNRMAGWLQIVLQRREIGIWKWALLNSFLKYYWLY